MNATGRIELRSGGSAFHFSVPEDVRPGDVMVLADVPYRAHNLFGWQRVDSVVDRTSAFVRVATAGDNNTMWTVALDGPPINTEIDHPVWVIMRDVYVGSHFDEREIPVEVPLDASARH